MGDVAGQQNIGTQGQWSALNVWSHWRPFPNVVVQISKQQQHYPPSGARYHW
jgi:hypothetical protein